MYARRRKSREKEREEGENSKERERECCLCRTLLWLVEELGEVLWRRRRAGQPAVERWRFCCTWQSHHEQRERERGMEGEIEGQMK